ncbi:putative E3 ubiquitin-protein ligase LIN [Salvia miltiorrhiza]|uniref:putative E3 ubiquitin-protein ligase LIN n=1 Tax=Salvia miltiorrhiza TaxID=226208 RepID=UPI0025ABD186|nr:putative E3 ubiquitin-protein ligase LIN [Salvia miltiorrhiza]
MLSITNNNKSSSTTTTAPMSAAEILSHTALFLLETVSQPELRRQLHSTFLERVPTALAKPLGFASQTVETAICSSSPSVRASSLRLAEKLLSSNPANPFSSFLLSLVHHISHRALDAALSLLDVFEAEPSLSRLEIAPFLFQELFLVHFAQILEWYDRQRSNILDSGNAQSILSEMNGGQASALKDLERDYEVLLEDNCRIFAQYMKQVLRSRGEEVIFPPAILLFRRGESEDGGDQHHIRNQGFESPNRRYNPIWCELEDRSLESKTTDSKRLSKFPSLSPVRVSAEVLMNQIPSRQNDDSQTQDKENIQKPALFDSTKKQQQSRKLSDRRCVDDSSMEEASSCNAPKDFVCPITTRIFEDPVTLETGQTYEREAIQEWVERGNSTCPITRHKLHSSDLPKTNYVLKRLIASWRERNPFPSVSPKSVITTADGAIAADLRLAIADVCTSEVLREAEAAVLRIGRCWREGALEQHQMLAMLAKPPVINGFVEMLLNSVDEQVLRATVFLLSELGWRDDNVVQTLTRVDSDVESIIQLLKKGVVEAVVLVYLLRPSATSLVEMELPGYLLDTLNSDEEVEYKMFMEPKAAAVLLLARILGQLQGSGAQIVRSIVSTGAIDKIVEALQTEQRVGAVSILLRCILEDGKCRNIVARKAELASLLEILFQLSDGERLQVIHFFSELVKLNRRNLNEKILRTLKDEGTFSTMHTLLIYLQNALPDQSPIVAGLLLQLDLLEEPRKMSIYREEAIDALISCLRNSESPAAQISAAETILSLQGRFSYSGKSLSRAILLKRAGLERSYVAFMRRDQRRHNISSNAQDTMEDEKAAEEWERKVAFYLVSHEFGLVFEGLAQGLRSNNEELNSVCFMAATWLIYMLSILPDTGIRGAARVCLLDHFVSIFKSDKNIEERALSMLGLNSFINHTEGLQDLAGHTKDILKGLRELKKSSAMAFEMLKVFSQEHDNSADIWSHQELSQEDCSNNGEVLAVTCFKGKLFSGHSDGTIKVWSARGSELCLVQEIREHTKPVTSLTVLQSTEKLYSGSVDRTVRIWSILEEGIYCEQVEEVKDQINNLVVATNIACFIPQGAGVKLHSWNGTSKLLNQHKHAKCLALVQGKLYCGCHDSSIQEIDLVTGTLGNIQTGTKKLIGKANPVYALQVHDGLLYAAGPSLDGANVKIWSTSNYSLVGSLPSTLDVRTMAVSSELVYLGSKVGSVEVWCRKKLNRVETLQTNLTSKIICMALDTNQDMLVTGTSDGRIQTWGLS